MRIRTHTNPLSVINRYEKINPYAVFPEFNGKINFEIGFGQCTFIKEYAEANKQDLVVGVEARKKAVDLMQQRLEPLNFKNILLLHGNGVLCLQDLFESSSLDNIFIFHPDPWHKQRHLKRRLINHDFIRLMEEKLKIGGCIHISTDVDDLWNEITQLFTAFPNFVSKPDDVFWANYHTRWDKISLEKNRPTHYSTFCLIGKNNITL